MRINSKSIHKGYGVYERQKYHGSTAVPIFQTVSYAHSTAEKLAEIFESKTAGYIYTRISNPTTSIFEMRMAELENGIGAVATSSGMAAISTVVMSLLRSGDHIIASSGIFGGTISLFTNTLKRFGIETTLVDNKDIGNFREAIRKNTRLIFLETIGNPKLDIPDIPKVANIAHEYNIPLILDSTVTTPYLVRGGDLGADIVIHSTTKYINGHGTSMGGVFVDTGNYNWSNGVYDDLKDLSRSVKNLAFLVMVRNLVYRDLGCCPSPMNSFLMLEGLETLGCRMEIHCNNALRLAQFLEKNPGVKWVNYPGLPSNPFFSRVKSFFGGKGGGLLTFGLGSKKRAFKFINSLKMACNLANIGDVRTLVIHPSSTIFHEFSRDDKKKMGVTEDMIRVSVGIEDINDIKEDFEKAIKKAVEE